METIDVDNRRDVANRIRSLREDNDFTVEELTEILASLLYSEYQLNIASEAKANVMQFIEKAKANETKESPVNARTISHLAQTIAHITQL